MPGAAGYIHQAADTMTRASAALQRQSMNDLLGAFEQFARAQPAAVFGAGILAGFTLSRFLKSSRAQAPLADNSGGYR